MVKKRIEILDGFRAIAILSVLLFHYYSRWIPPGNPISLYPYGEQYNYFRRGNLGVEFFFIISGFVIFYTLELTPAFSVFWKKRLIRLYPALVIISVITFLVFRLFDTHTIFPESHLVRDFEFSLTFISPEFFNAMLHHWHIKFYYLNGSFWSLWPEVQFYLLASILYYYNKQKFTRNFIAMALFIVFANWVVMQLYWGIFCPSPAQIASAKASGANIQAVTDMKYYWYGLGVVCNLPQYLVHFTIGILYYLLYSDKQNGIKPTLLLKITLLVFIIFQCVGVVIPFQVSCIYLFMNLLFLCFIYFPDIISFLGNKYITGIGVVSYITYLFHENIGVLLIYTLGHYFMPYGFVFPIILIFFFLFISRIYNKYIDSKIAKFLKNKLLRKEKV